MYFYKIYNTIFNSDISLSEIGLKEIDSDYHDVEIRLNNRLPDSFNLHPIYKISKNEGYFFRENIGLFKSSGGNLIEIDTFAGFDERLLKETLINFPTALCMGQRGYFVIHGSSICLKDNVFVFSGPSHSGKSTLAAYFFFKDHDVFSEDISVIDVNNNNLLPSNRYIKLSPAAANVSNFQYVDNLEIKARERNGYPLPHKKLIPKPVKNIFFLKWSNLNKINKMSNEEALQNLLKFSFISNETEDSKKILALLANANFFRLSLKKDLENLNDVYKMIIS